MYKFHSRMRETKMGDNTGIAHLNTPLKISPYIYINNFDQF